MKLLFVKCGEPAPDMAARCGDYEAWFRAALPDVDWDVVPAADGGLAGVRLGDYAGLLLTGSPASVAEPDPWMYETAELGRTAAARGTPILGVCFGHQILGWAWGGRVVRNPRGWELGTSEIELLPAAREDPLFRGVGDGAGRLLVNQTHQDVVDESSLPPVIRVLARNDQTPVQALAISDHVRGVQFHPEVSASAMREYCLRRAPFIGAERAKSLGAEATDTPAAARLLTNFVSHLVRKA